METLSFILSGIALLIVIYYRTKYKQLAKRIETFMDIAHDYSLMCEAKAKYIMHMNLMLEHGIKYDKETLKHCKDYYIKAHTNNNDKNV